MLNMLFVFQVSKNQDANIPISAHIPSLLEGLHGFSSSSSSSSTVSVQGSFASPGMNKFIYFMNCSIFFMSSSHKKGPSPRFLCERERRTQDRMVRIFGKEIEKLPVLKKNWRTGFQQFSGSGFPCSIFFSFCENIPT